MILKPPQTWKAAAALCLGWLLAALSGGLFSACAAEVTLEWDAVPAAAGYRLCMGETPGAYTRILEAGAATTLKITDLNPGKAYYFAAKSYSEAGLESAPSNEVTHVTPPAPETDPAAPEADGDTNGDGVSDLMAYALGLSPSASAPQALPRPALAGNALVLDYPADSSKTDVILISEASEDLQHWFTPGAPGAPEGYREEVLSTEGSVQTRRASVPCGARPVFFRLKAVRR